MKGGQGGVDEVGWEEVESAAGLGGTEVLDEGVGFVQEDVDIIVVVVVGIIVVVVFRLFLVVVHPLSRPCSISIRSVGTLIANGERIDVLYSEPRS